MVLIDDRNAANATTVLTTDRQTGLPTLITFCLDLHSLLARHAHVSLVVFALDGCAAAPGKPDAALPDDAVLPVARLAAEAAQTFAGARLYRIATDSFALILPAVSRPIALQFAERLRRRIEQNGTITATFAAAGAPEDAGEVGALIAVCEAALLCGTEGRNRVYAATSVESLPPAMARLANLLIARMVALIELGQQLQETEQQALHDPVTGLPNSRSCEQALPRFLERAARTDAPLALLLVDGDNLKGYNTEHGYEAGNEWIRRVAHTLEGHLRPGDYVARWLMGDEFLVLLPSTTPEQAMEVAERLRVAVACDTTDSRGTISIGICVTRGRATSDVLLDAARDALLEAKHSGKNCAVLAENVGVRPHQRAA